MEFPVMIIPDNSFSILIKNMSRQRKSPSSSEVSEKVAQNIIIGRSTELVKEIGRGSYGRVFLAQQIQEPRLYFVVKCISIKYANEESITSMSANLDVLKTLWSPYIVKLYAYLKTEKHLYLYFDYCDAGTLEEYIKSKKDPVSENEALIIFRQLIEGYKVLYENGLIHRDIKPENIMLHQGKVKIGGIAFSSVIFNVDFAVFRMHNILSIYGSPQMHRSRMIEGSLKHTNKTDIWSLGIVLYEMLYSKPPYPPKKYVKAVQSMEQPPIDYSKPVRSNYLIDILRKMLAFNEQDRMSWQELFQNPVFNDMAQSISLNWSAYSEMISAFSHYMTYNCVRGYFRIDIADINEIPIDPSMNITEIADRFQTGINIYKKILRDRNEAFFYCMIAWVYYRCSDKIPEFVNKLSEFEFVLVNKAIKVLKNIINLYFQNPDVPEGIIEEYWLDFKETHQYERARLLLYQDYTLLIRISQAIYDKIRHCPTISNRIVALVQMSQKKIQNEIFTKIYVDTLSEAIVELRKQKKISEPSLLLLDYMEKSFFPSHTFVDENFDYYKFYEQQQRKYGVSSYFMLKDRKNQIYLQQVKVQKVIQTATNQSGVKFSCIERLHNLVQPKMTASRIGGAPVIIPRPTSTASIQQSAVMTGQPNTSMVNPMQQSMRPPAPPVIQLSSIQQPQRQPYPPTPQGMQQSQAAYQHYSYIPPPPAMQPQQMYIPTKNIKSSAESTTTAETQKNNIVAHSFTQARPSSPSQTQDLLMRAPIVPTVQHNHINPELFPISMPHYLVHPNQQPPPSTLPRALLSGPPSAPKPLSANPQYSQYSYPQYASPQYSHPQYLPPAISPQQDFQRRPYSPIVKQGQENIDRQPQFHQSLVAPGAPKVFRHVSPPPGSIISEVDEQTVVSHGGQGHEQHNSDRGFLPTHSELDYRPPSRARNMQNEQNPQLVMPLPKNSQ